MKMEFLDSKIDDIKLSNIIKIVEMNQEQKFSVVVYLLVSDFEVKHC